MCRRGKGGGEAAATGWAGETFKVRVGRGRTAASPTHDPLACAPCRAPSPTSRPCSSQGVSKVCRARHSINADTGLGLAWLDSAPCVPVPPVLLQNIDRDLKRTTVGMAKLGQSSDLASTSFMGNGQSVSSSEWVVWVG